MLFVSDEAAEIEKAAALKVANEVRAMLGYPPVDHLYPGVRCDGANCPITNTIYDDDIDREEYGISTGSRILIDKKDGSFQVCYLPLDATFFVSHFDGGVYPELIKKD